MLTTMENDGGGCQTDTSTSRQTSASRVCGKARLTQIVHVAICHVNDPCEETTAKGNEHKHNCWEARQNKQQKKKKKEREKKGEKKERKKRKIRKQVKMTSIATQCRTRLCKPHADLTQPAINILKNVTMAHMQALHGDA